MASANRRPGDATVPVLKNLTIENITENVHRINSQCADPRLKYIMERLVSHLHDFARETRLSFEEWMAGIQFLTQVGQTCTDVRQVGSLSSRSRSARVESASQLIHLPGIHSPLRHRRPLPPRRLNRPPETSLVDRRHRTRSLSYTRCVHPSSRLLDIRRSRG
jgi:hypothetical protein